jgi:hypothetical protein
MYKENYDQPQGLLGYSTGALSFILLQPEAAAALLVAL